MRPDVIYVWNDKYEFWAEWGGPIGIKALKTLGALVNDGWAPCWIEPNVKKMGDEMLMGF